jgi:hypothetical protein
MNRVLICLLAVLVGGTVWAQPPQMITYQGLLTDASGSPVADGNYSLTFGIYDAATGGTQLWTETQSSVTVQNGLFKVQLGSVSALSLDFDDPYWLEVQVGGGAAQVPRVQLSSAPYSFMAMDSDQVDGFDASATATANTLLPLDNTGMFPESVIPSVPPSGTAGGDLTGTYPNPTIAANAVNTSKIQDGQVQTADIADGAVTQAKLDAGVTLPPGGPAGGDLTGTYPNPAIAANAVNSSKIQDGQVTTADIAPAVVSSVDGVTNDGGDVDLVAGANITITPNDGANTITIAAAGGGGGDITSVWPDGSGTLTGGADVGDVTLGVANPLEITGSSYGVIAGYNTAGNFGRLGDSVHGAYGEGGSGNYGYCGGASVNGAYGYHAGSGNYGGLGTSGEGAYGASGGRYGSLAGGYGAYGESGDGEYGYLGGVWGAYGEDPSGNWGGIGGYAYAVRGYEANDWAGYFSGDVNVTGSLSKGSGSFLIDHPLDPENKLLRHNFVESPENLLIYRGRVQLDGAGEAAVEMPAYFEALTKEDEASVHLTPVGRPFLTGAEWNPGFRSFTVYGEPDRAVFWEVLADRDDPVMRQLARPVEEDKGPDNKLCDRGKLLYPEAYGYPETMDRDYEELMQVRAQRAALHAEQEAREARHPGGRDPERVAAAASAR